MQAAFGPVAPMVNPGTLARFAARAPRVIPLSVLHGSLRVIKAHEARAAEKAPVADAAGAVLRCRKKKKKKQVQIGCNQHQAKAAAPGGGWVTQVALRCLLPDQ